MATRLVASHRHAWLVAVLGLVVGASIPFVAGQAVARAAWSDAMQLTMAPPGSPYIYGPDVAVDAAGNAHAVWLNYDEISGETVLQVATHTAGRDWSTPVDLQSGSIKNPRISVGPQGDVAIVWERYEDPVMVPEGNGVAGRGGQVGWTAYAASLPAGDGPPSSGAGWSEPRVLAGAAEQELRPAVAVAGDGEAVAAWEWYDGVGKTVQAAAWSLRQDNPSDGGWSLPPAQLSGSDPVSGQSREATWAQVAVYPSGDAEVIWVEDTGAGDAVKARERQHGGSWSEVTKTLSPPGDSVQAQLAVGANGTATAIWLNSGFQPWRVEDLVRPAGEDWPGPDAVDVIGTGTRHPRVAVDGRGNAFALWWGQSYDGERVTGASRPAGGEWRSQPLSLPGEDALNPALAAAGDGHAVAVWESGPSGAPSAADPRWVQAATIEIGDVWRSPVAVSDTQPVDNLYARAAMDPQGNAVAVWERCLADCEGIDEQGHPVPPTRVAEWSALDVAGPRLDTLSIPPAGTAGLPLSFSVAPLDVWSTVADISWEFGDGESAAGAAVSHTFAGPGDYPVRVTATDEYGNSTTQTRTVSVTAAPPPPSPPDEPSPTLPPVAPPQPATPGGGAGPSGGQAPPVLVFDAPVAVAGGAVAPVRIGCGADLSQGCSGTLSLRTARPVKTGHGGARRALNLGRSRFSLAAGESGTVRVRLTGPARRLLRRLGKLRVKVTVTLAGGIGPDPVTQTITLRAA